MALSEKNKSGSVGAINRRVRFNCGGYWKPDHMGKCPAKGTCQCGNDVDVLNGNGIDNHYHLAKFRQLYLHLHANTAIQFNPIFCYCGFTLGWAKILKEKNLVFKYFSTKF